MRRLPALTLIEIMVVLGIVAILAGVAWSGVQGLRMNQAMQTSAEEVKGAVTLAHIYAREARDERSWGVVRMADDSLTLVSSEGDEVTVVTNYQLQTPAKFGESWDAIWFGQGTGNTTVNREIQIVVPGGRTRIVRVSRTGVVEIL